MTIHAALLFAFLLSAAFGFAPSNQFLPYSHSPRCHTLIRQTTMDELFKSCHSVLDSSFDIPFEGPAVITVGLDERQLASVDNILSQHNFARPKCTSSDKESNIPIVSVGRGEENKDVRLFLKADFLKRRSLRIPEHKYRASVPLILFRSTNPEEVDSDSLSLELKQKLQCRSLICAQITPNSLSKTIKQLYLQNLADYNYSQEIESKLRFK